ncbi:hypothetical protein [Catellatospora sichuanensis]|uniref:hypothetical protein n=1 Tax=Catellatospora sichuanensis TaxID=1969805 RepID=UPI0011822E28|nr:hypothetical protein [Catellatospora sichuanensis]
MQLGDFSRVVHKTLRALPYQRYLAAAWIITCELDELYSPATPPAWRPLTADSLTTLRFAVERGADEVTAEANAVFWRWCVAMGYEGGDTDDIQPFDSPLPSGHTNLWFAWMGLMAELGGEAPRSSGLDPAMRAVTMYDPHLGPMEPISSQSNGMVFSVRMLRSFLQLAEVLGNTPGDDPMDMDALREQVFRQLA